MFDATTSYDVAVLGGGLCGFAAARALARTGARVALVERRPVLGWEATSAFRLELDEPTCETAQWLHDAMAAAGGCRDGMLDAPIAEIVLDQGATDAGMDVLFYAQPVAVGGRDGRLTAILLGTKSGEMAIQARAFIDATENALLWRLAGGVVHTPASWASRHALFLNGASGPALERSLEIGDVADCRGVVLRPGLWPGEVAVEFGIEGPDIRLARRALPGLLRRLREEVEGLANALVTSVGVEPYPLAAPRQRENVGFRHPVAASLIGAGPWVMPEEAEQEEWSLDRRLRLGEFAADAAEMVLGSLPEPPGDDPLPHSQVAPPAHEADVVVCGGGTGGALAAIASARHGASTILLEASTGLGGIGTGGGIHIYYHGVAGGLQDEVDRRVDELSRLFGPAQGFHPEAKKVVLEQMALEAGVRIAYETTITGVQTKGAPPEGLIPSGGYAVESSKHSPEGMKPSGGGSASRRLEGVVAAGPEGNALFRATAFVDATGDGDVAAMAGATFTFGRAADGLPHAYSLAAGRLGGDRTLHVTNFDAGYCDPTDVADLTRARRHALGHYRRARYEAASRLVYIAPILGLRNSRQVVGDYCLTLADEIAGRQFPDVVAYAYSHFDNHGFDYENESDEAMLWVWLLGNWDRRIGCEVPYRTLLPAGIDGLLMGCRALSMTHDAHNQLRMQRDLQRIGEVAGVAAALAVRAGLTPRELSVASLQAALLATGALGPRERPALPALPEGSTAAPPEGSNTFGRVFCEPGTGGTLPKVLEPPGGAAALEARLHDSAWAPPEVPALPLAERIAQLGTEKTQEAAYDLIRRGEEALPLLLQAAKDAKPAVRLWASVALAMARRPEAGPELRACLAERRAEAPEGRKTGPLWRSAMVLLGRIGGREAVPELIRVLEDPSADLDALIAAVRALARVGDPAAIPALEALVERPGLPTQRQLQVSTPAGHPVIEDCRWQLDLAVAEALARLGKPRPDLAARHAHDERSLVRRNARRVADLASQPAARNHPK